MGLCLSFLSNGIFYWGNFYGCHFYGHRCGLGCGFNSLGFKWNNGGSSFDGDGFECGLNRFGLYWGRLNWGGLNWGSFDQNGFLNGGNFDGSFKRFDGRLKDWDRFNGDTFLGSG